MVTVVFCHMSVSRIRGPVLVHAYCLQTIVRSALLHPLCEGWSFERPAKQLKSRREYGGNMPIPQFSHF